MTLRDEGVGIRQRKDMGNTSQIKFRQVRKDEIEDEEDLADLEQAIGEIGDRCRYRHGKSFEGENAAPHYRQKKRRKRKKPQEQKKAHSRRSRKSGRGGTKKKPHKRRRQRKRSGR